VTARLAKPAIDRQTAASVEQLLRTRHAELTNAIRSLLEIASASENQASADYSDRATATCQTEIDAAQLDRLTRQLGDVEAALLRLSRGEYGICDDCGSFIGLTRLKTLPFTRVCRPCRSRAEALVQEPHLLAQPRQVAR